jgi:hypothetical protein
MISAGPNSVYSSHNRSEKIAIEIKTFAGDSPITDYHTALDRFLFSFAGGTTIWKSTEQFNAIFCWNVRVFS